MHQSVDEAAPSMRAAAAEATKAVPRRARRRPSSRPSPLAGAAEKLIERGQLDLAVQQLGRAGRRLPHGARRRGARRRARGAREGAAGDPRGRAEAEGVGAETLAADAFAAAAREQPSSKPPSPPAS
jgi:hypothetical protein